MWLRSVLWIGDWVSKKSRSRDRSDTPVRRAARVAIYMPVHYSVVGAHAPKAARPAEGRSRETRPHLSTKTERRGCAPEDSRDNRPAHNDHHCHPKRAPSELS